MVWTLVLQLDLGLHLASASSFVIYLPHPDITSPTMEMLIPRVFLRIKGMTEHICLIWCLSRIRKWWWRREGSEVKSIDRGPKLGSITYVRWLTCKCSSGDLTPSSALLRHLHTCGMHTLFKNKKSRKDAIPRQEITNATKTVWKWGL